MPRCNAPRACPGAMRRKFFFRGTGLPTVMRKTQPLVPRSNFGGKACARTARWFRGQTLPVPGHGGGTPGSTNRHTQPSWNLPPLPLFFFLSYKRWCGGESPLRDRSVSFPSKSL